jgi:hypothetical protein
MRADELLRDESVWNRDDDRQCDDDESTGKRSLFCALRKACVDALGVYDHRRVALQEVRFAVEQVTEGKKLEMNSSREESPFALAGFTDSRFVNGQVWR